ncbi:hypothetical protein ES703_02110 [subsurface metagenome]
MAKKILCPIEGCERSCKTPETLNSHLYIDHTKNKLSATIVVLMDLVNDIQTELKDLKWKFRTHV